MSDAKDMNRFSARSSVVFFSGYKLFHNEHSLDIHGKGKRK